MAVRAVTFASHDCDRFVEDVKSKVADYFQTNKLDTKAGPSMILKTIVMVSGMVVPYALIMSNQLGAWAMLACCVVMGVAMAGIGFSVSHDALHGAYSSNPRINAAIGFTFDMLGASGYMWKITHNVIHHTYTNIHGIDEDLEVTPLLRLSPVAKHHPWQKFQHLYAPIAYSMSTINWVFVKDFDLFSRKNLGPYLDKKHPRSQWALLVFSKLFALTWMLALPMLFLSVAWWQVVIGFLAMHLIGGTILGVIFQLAHVVEQTSHPVPDDLGRMPNGWLVHEMLTTANFCVGNKVLTWYCGGLNHQIEHHLFPKVCSVHYPAISGIVRTVASEHGIPYHLNPTFTGAFASHLKMLKRLGHAESPNIVRAEAAVAA
jgi:linoleoyl-CoA desaturase